MTNEIKKIDKLYLLKYYYFRCINNIKRIEANIHKHFNLYLRNEYIIRLSNVSYGTLRPRGMKIGIK
jgi:hypothetical protein